MIKFFRRIRHTLLSENRFSKYLIYALGEIILVVIGILLALQINTWNEARKDKAVGDQYLADIRQDLENDLDQMKGIMTAISYEISVITSIDSSLYKIHAPRSEEGSKLFVNPFELTPDSIHITSIFYRNRSFRPAEGTYTSLIADGKSGLIKNRDLLLKIQAIYDGENKRLASTYESIKAKEEKVNWTYPFEIKRWTYTDLKKAKDEKIFYDAMRLVEEKLFYAGNLIRTKEKIMEVTDLINKELADD
ncbi:MAG: hypothetical protein ED555_02935 [Allomuricauda sp.]|nr:MAG: hypothetical protein ED555_02935 [Allomuricauda sp.]